MRNKVKLNVFLIGSFLGSLTGCASLVEEGGMLEDKSFHYKDAQSLDRPLEASLLGVEYEPEPLYPIPTVAGGALFLEAPRVRNAFIPLEQGAIALVKSGTSDRVIVSALYGTQLLTSVKAYLKHRNLTQLTTSTEVKLLQESLASELKGRQAQAVILSTWASSESLGYEPPGFWKRLFGAKRLEHQFAWVLQELEPISDSASQYEYQFRLMHRTRSSENAKASDWIASSTDDAELTQELMTFIGFLQQEVALASAGPRRDITATLEKDGNGLPYLAISDRFPLVWETLLDVIPEKKWRIKDLDRSKGIVYLEVLDDKTLAKLNQKLIHLQLIEGPQMMILSVEVNENQPADVATSSHVLTLLQTSFTSEFGRKRSE